MLRKFAAGTSAALVAAGLAAAPAVAAAGLPASPGDSCGDTAPSEQNAADYLTTSGFVFGPLADVPQLLSGHPACFTAAAPPEASSARRRSSAPPSVGESVPEGPGL